MFDDLTKEIKAQLYERARSPLFGAFIVSWMAWNIRLLIVLLSNAKVEEKIAHLDKLYPTACEYCLNGFFYPVFTAVVFIIVYPFPARWAYEYWHRQHLKIKEIQQKIEDDTPITREEANALRKTSLEQQVQLQNQIRALSETNREISNREAALLEKIGDSEKKENTLQQEIDRLNDDLRQLTAHYEKKNLAVSSSPLNEIADTAIGEQPPQDVKGFFNRFKKLDFSDIEVERLMTKISAACTNYSITIEMLGVLTFMTLSDGTAEAELIAKGMRDITNSVEFKHTLNQLRTKGMVWISPNGEQIRLSEEGQKFAVESGLTKITKFV